MSALVDENTLIEASIRGDRKAFREIVAKYQSLVCSVAYSATGDLSESEDLAQETFIVAWQKLESLQDRDKLSSWLCGIVKNIARDTHRKSKRDLSYDATPLDEAVAAVNAVQIAERVTVTEREAVMWAALEEIPETYREPLILFYRRGESVREVAQALDISEDAAKQRLSRGRKMLKEQVAAFIEKSLSDTNPGKAFTIAVIATLPVLATTTAAAAVTSGSIAGASVAGKGTIKVAFWTAMFGSVAFMTLGLFYLWLLIRTAPDSDARRQVVRSSAGALSAIWTVLGVLSIGATVAFEADALVKVGITAGFFAVAAAAGAFIARSNSASSSGENSFTFFTWTTVVTLTGSFAFVLGTSWVALPFLLVSHVVCAVMFYLGWRKKDDAHQVGAETLSYSPKWALIICTGMLFLAAIPSVRGFSASFSEGQYVGAIGYAPMVLILPLILIGAIGGVIESKRNQREDNTELGNVG